MSLNHGGTSDSIEQPLSGGNGLPYWRYNFDFLPFLFPIQCLFLDLILEA